MSKTRYTIRQVGAGALKLTFEGHAVVETRSGGVNFAGQYTDHDGRLQDVLCRVTGEVLQTLGGLKDPTPDQLLDTYFRFSAKLNPLASAQYSAGIANPQITLRDIPRDWISASQAA
jgi:hypothetical protein